MKAQFGEEEGKMINRCDECGATFRKPAYLKQHMQGHSVEVRCSEAPARFIELEIELNHFLKKKHKLNFMIRFGKLFT